MPNATHQSRTSHERATPAATAAPSHEQGAASGSARQAESTRPTAEQLAALSSFAAKNGRRWKSALGHAWETGDYSRGDDSASLQQVRNNFGPSWLVRFRFPVAA